MPDRYAGQKDGGGCACRNLDIHAHARVFNDTNLRRVVLQLRCADCGNEAQFLAIPIDQKPEQPSTSPDGRTVYLPILMMPPEAV